METGVNVKQISSPWGGVWLMEHHTLITYKFTQPQIITNLYLTYKTRSEFVLLAEAAHRGRSRI